MQNKEKFGKYLESGLKELRKRIIQLKLEKEI